METFEASASGRARSAARAEGVVTALSRSALPAPRTTPSDPVALGGPGAPEAIREAARTIGEQIATDDGAVEREPEEYLVSGKPAVDGETARGARRHREGGSNWSDASSKEKTPKEIKEDADAFAVKLCPAGRILHMVSRREPEPRTGERKSGEKKTPFRGRRVRGAPARERERLFPRSATLETSRGKRYELYADVSVEAYDRIRLSRTMLSDHFLPKYIEALEDVRAGLEAEIGAFVASVVSERAPGTRSDDLRRHRRARAAPRSRIVPNVSDVRCVAAKPASICRYTAVAVTAGRGGRIGLAPGRRPDEPSDVGSLGATADGAASSETPNPDRGSRIPASGTGGPVGPATFSPPPRRVRLVPHEAVEVEAQEQPPQVRRLRVAG